MNQFEGLFFEKLSCKCSFSLWFLPVHQKEHQDPPLLKWLIFSILLFVRFSFSFSWITSFHIQVYGLLPLSVLQWCEFIDERNPMEIGVSFIILAIKTMFGIRILCCKFAIDIKQHSNHNQIQIIYICILTYIWQIFIDHN